MKISDYITQRGLQRVNAVPAALMHKFDLADEVEFYSSADHSRAVEVCQARNFFAAWKPEAITTGNLNESYPTLRSF